MNAAEPLPEQLLGELRLRRTRKKKYYLINLKVGEGTPQEKLIFLDPEVRTFLTGIACDKIFLKSFGKNAVVRI